MNVPGTISRPHAHEPEKQVPTMKPSPETPNARPEAETVACGERQNRKLEMQLMPEALARAQYQERMREAETERRALALVAARRLQRRAERVQLRARRALAMAVMN
ncbi:hypothetical protein SRB5_64660 [Streptomyces sp. RB5]|uniref:Uncharacterized protein n=1 Tax=Streptomyces smaragdinus TaxID=2585196 RepID=A0A7K0CS65_9ACTN|nr:hypothetical protein [Streptomyces smaragdinus]MQY16268.1 hypothetical protein [Streptomyces smaragdinus]